MDSHTIIYDISYKSKYGEDIWESSLKEGTLAVAGVDVLNSAADVDAIVGGRIGVWGSLFIYVTYVFIQQRNKHNNNVINIPLL
jgi:hypothetical protein